MRAHVLQGGEAAQDVQGGLGPHARHARDVVARVADQGLQVRPGGGLDAGFGREFGLGDEFFRLARGVVEHHRVGEALLEVLVRADDDHRALCAEARGQARDAVVGLGGLGHDDRHAEQGQPFQKRRHLPGQGLGHGFAVCLVVGVDIAAKRRPAAVQEKNQMRGGFVPQQFEQQAEDHVQGVGGEPVRTGDVAEGVVAAVDKGAAVDEEDGLGAEAQSFGQGHGAPSQRRRAASLAVFTARRPWVQPPVAGSRQGFLKRVVE